MTSLRQVSERLEEERIGRRGGVEGEEREGRDLFAWIFRR